MFKSCFTPVFQRGSASKLFCVLFFGYIPFPNHGFEARLAFISCSTSLGVCVCV